MKIMERGQVTIPKKYRDKYGIAENMEVDFIPKKEGLLIVKKTSRNTVFKEVFGILRKNIRTDKYIEQIRGGK
jgi:AbrB family looped-hinge helix DNA binding protein